MTELRLRKLLQTIFNSVCAGICAGFLILAVTNEGLRWYLWTMFGPACMAGLLLVVIFSIWGYMVHNSREIERLESES